jgi:hypothetical protein
MRTRTRALAAPAALALALAACAGGEAARPAAPPPVEVKATGTPGQAAWAQVQRVRATVKSVDAAARTVTLEDPVGRTDTIKVGPEVQRLDALAPGDEVAVDLDQGLLLEYQPAGSPDVAPRLVVATERGPTGGAPSAGAAAGVQGTVTVRTIDRQTRLVTLETPAGKRFTVRVGPAIALEKLQPGDRVLATYVEATVLRVVKTGTAR